MKSTLFNDAFNEVQTSEKWSLQSARMLKRVITPDSHVIARKGSMIANQGNVEFKHQGSKNVGHFMKKAFTSEDQPLMTVSGTGDVFFANNASNVFLIDLEGNQDSITVNGSSLLAFDSNLNWDITFIKNASSIASGSGLFNLELSGTGTVGICSNGEPLILDCSTQPTFVDPQAIVCWSSNLKPTIKVNKGAALGTLIGRGSGESIQMMFQGEGFVIVQPAENRGSVAEG